jgi:3-methylcrotonyl-CoA carboxylase beta subunit
MSADAVVTLSQLADQFAADEATIALGGGQPAIERQNAKGRLFVRDRLKLLLDPDTPWLELGLWAGWQMYDEWGGAPSAASSVALAPSKVDATS